MGDFWILPRGIDPGFRIFADPAFYLVLAMIFGIVAVRFCSLFRICQQGGQKFSFPLDFIEPLFQDITYADYPDKL